MTCAERILERWNNVGWIPPMFTLMYHATHMAGGAAVVLVLLGFGCEWIVAATVSTLFFFSIELLTAIVRGNWKDSAFDSWQYLAHWIVFFLSVHWMFGAMALALFAGVYFVLLLRGW